MVTRDDLTVDYLESPRIIEIAAPSTEITMQDLVDTVRIDEYSFSTPGMANPKLLNASGKEDLGGGVLVGITADLQDAQLSFHLVLMLLLVELELLLLVAAHSLVVL